MSQPVALLLGVLLGLFSHVLSKQNFGSTLRVSDVLMFDVLSLVDCGQVQVSVMWYTVNNYVDGFSWHFCSLTVRGVYVPANDPPNLVASCSISISPG